MDGAASCPASSQELERIAKIIHDKGGPVVAPLQVAALLLERATEEVNDEAIETLAKAKAS